MKQLRKATAIFLIGFFLLHAPMTEASVSSGFWDRREVRKALEGLPDPRNMERTLQFEVRDAESGEIIPEVLYRVNNWPEREDPPHPASGNYRHTLTTKVGPYTNYTISAEDYGTQSHFLRLGSNYDTVVDVKVHLKKPEP